MDEMFTRPPKASLVLHRAALQPNVATAVIVSVRTAGEHAQGTAAWQVGNSADVSMLPKNGEHQCR